MANPAFMEGIHAAKKGKSIKDNPYRDGFVFIDQHKAGLWDIGFHFGIEQVCAAWYLT